MAAQPGRGEAGGGGGSSFPPDVVCDAECTGVTEARLRVGVQECLPGSRAQRGVDRRAAAWCGADAWGLREGDRAP